MGNLLKNIAIWGIWIIVGVGAIASLIFAYLVFSSWQSTNEEDKAEYTSEVEMAQSGQGEGESEESEAAGNYPSETAFRNDLHKMTHQKVTASEKWGHLEITEERIDNMLQILEEYGVDNYSSGHFFEEVLNEWKNGDFSNAVEVHNTIWSEENGTVGRATGLMTESEEQSYIEKHFE
ncbi:DUF6241 domain-containing protein [Lentibacillus sediminis]|uniref:DUF6241 domain-containing protein n=1 Tax=Lentibacillus sediminis TaxID=1940529 RepID=UPI000C1BBA07|nr:DUF6241 domain-containing protein [Lentibacillus sediminis]